MKSRPLISLALGAACFACSSRSDPNHTATTEEALSWRRHRVDADFLQTPIVTSAQDPNLINTWGLVFARSGLAWIADNGMGLASVYRADGTQARTPVTIPLPMESASTASEMAPDAAPPAAAPTGVALNGNPEAFKGDQFIFVTEDGTISGFRRGDSAVLRVDRSQVGLGAVYKGVTIGDCHEHLRLYAANFRFGTVDVFDDDYEPVTLPGGFVDENLPAGFAPFNLLAVGDDVIVTFALQNDMKHDDVSGAGNGFVDRFDANGKLEARLISGGVLNSPWGLAFAPKHFEGISRTLLIGNFGDGHINAFRVGEDDTCRRAEFVAALTDLSGVPLAIDGLWSIRFGNDVGGFSSHTLYFTAGPNGESAGIFGKLTPR
jgi:uncharacterized protein (TIGR03118 family)